MCLVLPVIYILNLDLCFMLREFLLYVVNQISGSNPIYISLAGSAIH
jgi:hypothetical protein